MGGVFCRKCGEPWDFYYVTHEMAPDERKEFLKGISCPKCRKRIPDDAEKDLALSSLIETLNEIESEVRQIINSLHSTKGIASVGDADNLVEGFFYSCQIGEERIKTARNKDFITDIQVQALNNELRGFVRKMLDVSATSPFLINAIKKFLEEESRVKELVAAV
jgi:hypothetical protein